MNPDLQSTIKDLAELASSLTQELETTLLEKQASDSKVQELTVKLAGLQKLAEAAARDKVILEKVASHGIASPALIPILGRLEKAGFLKQGASMEAYEDIKRRPDHLVDLLQSIAESFGEQFSEGSMEKLAADDTDLPEMKNPYAFVDISGWGRIITEGA